MAKNKRKPTGVSVEKFLDEVDDNRRHEADVLIDIMRTVSGFDPVMWGPSIIGFGSQHYKYESGHEGDMPLLAFSPRKAKLTVYFEGFDNYTDELASLGKHKISKACLYIHKLDDVDLKVLRQMIEKSFRRSTK